MTSALALSPAATIAVIGAGRVGRVLAGAFRAAGLTVAGPLSRGESAPVCDIAILCVPDSAIPDAAAAARSHAALVGHVSGATGLEHADFSIHPLQTLTGIESPEIFHGIGAAIAGRAAEALAVAECLACALGAVPFEIDDAHRAGYHAAASLASNLVLTVLDAAEQVALAAGMPPGDTRTLLAPLAERTVENWVRTGAPAALTGPIARGDDETVGRQRDAIDATAPELTGLFDALSTATRVLAARTDPARPAATAPAATKEQP